MSAFPRQQVGPRSSKFSQHTTKHGSIASLDRLLDRVCACGTHPLETRGNGDELSRRSKLKTGNWSQWKKRKTNIRDGILN